MISQYLTAALILGLDDILHFLIDLICTLVRLVRICLHIFTKEHLAVRFTELQRSELVTHTVFRYHLTCNARRTLEVVVGTCGHFTEVDLFGNTSSKKTDDLIFKLRLRHEVTVFTWQHNGITACLSAWNDGHFVHHIGIIKHHTDYCMPRFVECNDISFFFRNDLTLLSRSGNYSVCRFIDIAHIYLRLVMSCRNKSCFVQQVLKVSTCKSWSTLGNCFQIDSVIKRFIARMHFKYGFTASYIRSAHLYLSVKTARSQ